MASGFPTVTEVSDSSGPKAARAEHRDIGKLLALIEELTGQVSRVESASELFARSFRALFHCLPFDVAAGVMIEQNLDLYLATREGAEGLINDRLIARIRATLQTLIPVSFATTEVVVKSETHDLPRHAIPGDALENETHAIFRLDGRTAGILLLYRGGEPFDHTHRQILEIFSAQVSLLLSSIRSRDQLSALAETDDLTGIWNKRFFRRQLPQEVERARVYNVPLSLLIFDVDEFKQINDSFGHTVGDVVLSELCGAVREMLRPPDLFARFGGDEFSIILPHTDLRGACAVAERILTRVSQLTIPADEEGSIRCSISIGVAEFQHDHNGATELVRRADERLYDSKRLGKNRYTA